MFALRYTRLVALGILMVAGCGNTGSGTDAGNCAANPPGCICRTDGNCGGANPRCNNSDGQCVPCLPTNDNCAQGQHCVNDSGTFKCVATTVCISAVDCPRKTPNATPACCNGTCVDNTLSDAANCGGCDLKCPSFMNAEPACIGGACAIAKCNTGFDNCDGNLANGCETNTAADVRHCGNCATVCTTGGNATPQCMAGKCMAGCVAGFQDCDGSLNNGCEVSTDTDARNCGACGKACGALQNAATVVCKAGACTAGSCAGWYGDCDNNPANGCESDTQGEAANCGGCGKPCAAVANGTPGCANGACTVNKCNAGYGNCGQRRQERLRGQDLQRRAELRRLRHLLRRRQQPAELLQRVVRGGRLQPGLRRLRHEGRQRLRSERAQRRRQLQRLRHGLPGAVQHHRHLPARRLRRGRLQARLRRLQQGSRRRLRGRRHHPPRTAAAAA